MLERKMSTVIFSRGFGSVSIAKEGWAMSFENRNRDNQFNVFSRAFYPKTSQTRQDETIVSLLLG
jgi:hypothetical protein